MTSEDKLFKARILDLIDLCNKHWSPKFSLFLDEKQCFEAEKLLKSIKFSNYLFYGGFNSAERKVLGIFPEYCVPDIKNFPVVSVKFDYRDEDKLFHKDFLGSLMAIQIKRETVGDILVSDGKTIVLLYNTVYDSVLSTINKIGSVGVKVSIHEGAEFAHQNEFLELSGTVASLRLDCIISLALKISREKAALLIRSNGISVNCSDIFSPSYIISEHDVFSARGFGKFILDKVGAISKKDRTHITIKKYI